MVYKLKANKELAMTKSTQNAASNQSAVSTVCADNDINPSLADQTLRWNDLRYRLLILCM